MFDPDAIKGGLESEDGEDNVQKVYNETNLEAGETSGDREHR